MRRHDFDPLSFVAGAIFTTIAALGLLAPAALTGLDLGIVVPAAVTVTGALLLLGSALPRR
jgi:hypothetical protein